MSSITLTRAALQAWEAFAEATLTRQPEAGEMGRELVSETDAVSAAMLAELAQQ